jgi:hypothetical protein
MIGPGWATITNSAGQRRLEDANDFVRLEIASALKRNIAVIPVLVHDSKMPHPDQLPDNLKDLAYRNSVEITHARWNSDVQLLTKALGQYVTSTSDTNKEPVHATVAVQLPPPNAPAEQPTPVKASKTPLIAGVSLAAVVLIAVAAFFAFRASGNRGTAATSATQPATHSGAAPAPLTGVSSSSLRNPVAGTWANPSPSGRNGLAKLEISGTGNHLSMHAWGECQGCDWGPQTATFDGQRATAVWSFQQPMAGEAGGRVATVTVSPGGDALNVTVVNAFPKRAPNERRSRFVRAQ